MPKKFTKEEFIEKARRIHGDKYDYSKVEYKNIDTKVCIICPEHGEFWQRPSVHIYDKCGCPKCFGIYDGKSFIEKARRIHGDKYDYSKVEYKKSNEKVCIICPEHGEFWQRPNDHLSGYGCYKCANHMYDNNEFIRRAKIVHNDKYDYSKTRYKSKREKVCIICPEHGEFWQQAGSHLQGNGCPKCANDNLKNKLRLNNTEFVNRARQIHGNKYDYSKSNYIDSHTKVCIICPKHGEFWQEPNNHINNNYGCPKCSETSGERKIRLFLENKEEEFIYQFNTKWLGKQTIDFYIPKYNLGVEYDGIQHFRPINYFGGEKGFYRRKQLDNLKNKLCYENKLKLLRIPYTDFDNIEKILEENLK